MNKNGIISDRDNFLNKYMKCNQVTGGSEFLIDFRAPKTSPPGVAGDFKALPERSMSTFLLESISAKTSWKWSLTAARTARWAEKEPPFVRRVMSQKSPASLWLLSLLSRSAPCDGTVLETHLRPSNRCEAKTERDRELRQRRHDWSNETRQRERLENPATSHTRNWREKVWTLKMWGN